MKTLNELRNTAEWQAAEYMETRHYMLADNNMQAEVEFLAVLEDLHADVDDCWITDWYTDVPAEEVVEIIEGGCPGIQATVESPVCIRWQVRSDWTLVTKEELGVDELLGD